MAKLTLNEKEHGVAEDLELDAGDEVAAAIEEDWDDPIPDDDLYYGDDPEEVLEDEPDDAEELVWDGDDLSRPVVPTPGCAVSFFADNKRHHAICLAIIGDEVLLEHKDATRCFLFIGKVTEIVPRIRRGVVSATITVGTLKKCRYHSVPKKWLQEMIRTGQSWKGMEGGGKVAPPPGDLLKGQMDLF
ncbi:hypothetical protein [Citrifermentans bremense]|uniref:hypothetical protein n=1 Tax=Citrifermentans bremense TaxID=60035 RepID=UPI00040DEBA0|nr:hypothetical protein [Citrifermentans bremense]